MRPRIVGLLGVLTVTLSGALAGQSLPLGAEFQVNTNTAYDKTPPTAAMDPSGEFVVVWGTIGAYPTFGDIAINAQRFDASGAKLGGEIMVNSFTTENPFSPAVAKDTSGNFVVVWLNDAGASTDLVVARRFDATGAPLGGEIPVTTTGISLSPTVASDGDGNFVVVWRSQGGVFGQRYDNTGASVGGQFQANTSTEGSKFYPQVAMGAGGNFVVVWSLAYSAQPEVVGRRYDSSGNPQGGEIEVAQQATDIGDLAFPAIAMDADGNFVVAWADRGVEGDGDHLGVLARRYDAAGIALGEPFHVNSYTTGAQFKPSVGMDAAGEFVITWSSAGQDGSEYGIFGQRFASSGRKQGSEFQVNTQTAHAQDFSSVAVNPSGRVVIAWLSLEFPILTFGEFAKVGDLDTAQPLQVDVHPSAGPSNLNGVFEPGETAQVEPAWKDTLPDPTTLVGTASGLTGPPGPTYTTNDAGADYGTIQPGSVSDCYGATQDCFQMTISGARPAPHWDATFDESRSDGLTKTWILHVGESFTDAPTSNAFYAFIENIFHNGVTGGCGGTDYCPDASTLREQMAVFVLKAKEGAGFVPPPAVGVFTDVPASDPFAPWIEELYRRGVVAGCGAGPIYCPKSPVSRQQMAVFLLKTLEGSGYTPPACAGVFGDVTCPGLFTDWVEELYHRQITGGCNASPLLYCPTNDVTRGQMAPFLVKTFALLLYGP